MPAHSLTCHQDAKCFPRRSCQFNRTWLVPNSGRSLRSKRENEQYHVAEFAPELRAFGSDGGGEMLAFDAKDQIVSVPFIGMEMQYAQIIAPTWRDFERILSI